MIVVFVAVAMARLAIVVGNIGHVRASGEFRRIARSARKDGASAIRNIGTARTVKLATNVAIAMLCVTDIGGAHP